MKTLLSKGPALFLLSSFLFAVMGVFVKLGSQYAPISEIAFVRFALGIIVALSLSAAGKINLVSSEKTLLVARGVFGGLAIVLFYLSIKNGTLTNATVLNNTYPIFATLWAALYLKERITRSVILPLMTSILGIFLLTHPDFSQIKISDLYGLGSGLLAGVSIVIIRKLSQTESAWSVFFYLSIFGAVFSGVMALPTMRMPEYPGIVYISASAVLGTIAQVLMTAAYRYCTTSVGSVLSMSTAVFSSLFGLVFFGEKLNLSEFTGVAAILASSGYLAYIGSSTVRNRDDNNSGEKNTHNI